MTVLCAGGPSQPKPGVVDDVIYAAGFLGLVQLAPGLEWLIPFIPLLGNLAYHTPDLCSTDPPGFATFTGADALALAIADPGPAGHTARQKVADTLATVAWHVLCECVTGGTPAIPAAPPAPVVPQMVAANTSWPCERQTMHLAGGLSTTIAFMNAFFMAAQELHPTSARFTVVQTPSGSVHPLIDWQLRFNRPTPAPTQVIVPLGTFGPGTNQVTVPWPATYGTLELDATAHAATTDILDYCVEAFCDMPPGIPVGNDQAGCCPPDPAITAQLQLITDMLQEIVGSQTTTTRSYAEGTVHAGLTGSGTISLVDSAIAVKVTITTDNGALRTKAGSPTYLYDRGFIVPIAAEGPIRGVTRLVYNPQVYQLPPPTDAIGYQLGAGITASITELVRGP